MTFMRPNTLGMAESQGRDTCQKGVCTLDLSMSCSIMRILPAILISHHIIICAIAKRQPDSKFEHQEVCPVGIFFVCMASPQKGDLRLSGPPSGKDAGSGARTYDRKVPLDLRAVSLSTVPPSMLCVSAKQLGNLTNQSRKLGRVTSVMEEESFKSKEKTEEEEEGERNPVSFSSCLMLVSPLFGIEMSMSFEQVYEILVLQFLGVPLELVSVNGIIAGCLGTLLLPALGVWTDGGNNPRKRKLLTLIVGLCVFLSGPLLLSSASLIKIHRMNKFSRLIHNCSKENLHGLSNYSVNDFGGEIVDTLILNNHTSASDRPFSIETKESILYNQSVTGIVLISILGFMGLDLGFDLIVSLSRASILESVPKCQHKFVLSLATIVQSLAGFSCSLIGCFDLPGFLGSRFHADGAAATLIFFCCVLIAVTLVGFSLMGLATFRLKRKRNDSNNCSFPADLTLGELMSSKMCNDESLICSLVEKVDVAADSDYLKEQKLSNLAFVSSQLTKLLDNQLFASNTNFMEEFDHDKRTLLLQDNSNTNYCSINANHSYYESFYRSIQHHRQQETHVNSSLEDTVNGRRVEKVSICNFSEHSQEIPIPSNANSDLEERVTHEASLSLEDTSKPQREAHRENTGLEKIASKEERPGVNVCRRQLKKKLTILCVSSFFAMGAQMCVTVYAANALNTGIIHGDPVALPGTQGRERYELGLRLGSIGNLIQYASFMVVSLASTRISAALGERCYYVVNHVILIIGLVAVLTFQRRDVYMMFMVCGGLYRPCFLTLPFVLAHQMTQDSLDTESDAEDSQRASHNGRVMTLIGCLIPAHYAVLSIVMGPLMEATGNPWVPLYYCLGSGSVSLGVFALLFYV
ncbi:proton-associated sugar transporter a [Plakobranchus ocellatus]|uniref:Proton-associated sugar transporter a n=1 Tax=Plakobranchus ocellatus TaxID=259542 RepID=A0AAV4A452_9GAST|nr:proton-associated sugar transporter a [Plakobranchus ocellatus]